MERIVENFPESLSDKYLFIIKDVYILYQIRITFLSYKFFKYFLH